MFVYYVMIKTVSIIHDTISCVLIGHDTDYPSTRKLHRADKHKCHLDTNPLQMKFWDDHACVPKEGLAIRDLTFTTGGGTGSKVGCQGGSTKKYCFQKGVYEKKI